LWSSGHSINGLHQSDPVKGQINTTNINEPSQNDNNRSLSDNRELGIWHNSAGKTL